ncbi:hypothetical protein CC2G_013347 [Coprinopsis cinerea AmutBmut pab1-1]|nr:hypothetical protein CC2G_013347 [Coprinopsis cinerea AmutBmut pab1-1]
MTANICPSSEQPVPPDGALSLAKFRGFGCDSDNARSTVGPPNQTKTSRKKGSKIGPKKEGSVTSVSIGQRELTTTRNELSQKRSIDTAGDSRDERKISLARFREWSESSLDSRPDQSPTDANERDNAAAAGDDNQADGDALTVENCTIIREFLEKQIQVATWEVYEAKKKMSMLRDFKNCLVQQLEQVEQAIEERHAHVREGPSFGRK